MCCIKCIKYEKDRGITCGLMKLSCDINIRNPFEEIPVQCNGQA
jgi:hypothetical protein